MSNPATNQQPTPFLFFDTVGAYQRTEALKAAIDLDLFTAIAEGVGTTAALASRCGASERGTRILCDFLTIIGFLTKQDGRYSLTLDSSVFLDRRSPAYLGGAVKFLNNSTLTAGFSNLAGAVRKGGTVISEEGTVSPDNPVWVEFARSMAPALAVPAKSIPSLLGAGVKRVLDIAAGHGLFGIEIARANPGAEITALDWPAVLEVAKENARSAGVDAHYRTIPGSAFEVEFGNGYDVILLTNFLHHFDVPTCEALLRKVHAALAPGGRVVTLEFVPDENRISPPMSATFSLTMLATTAHGDAYTFAELDSMFRNAGFARSELHELPPGVERVVVSNR